MWLLDLWWYEREYWLRWRGGKIDRKVRWCEGKIQLAVSHPRLDIVVAAAVALQGVMMLFDDNDQWLWCRRKGGVVDGKKGVCDDAEDVLTVRSHRQVALCRRRCCVDDADVLMTLLLLL